MAVEALEDLLEAKKYPAVRLGAAMTIAEFGIRQYDADIIRVRKCGSAD